MGLLSIFYGMSFEIERCTSNEIAKEREIKEFLLFFMFVCPILYKGPCAVKTKTDSFN